MAFGTGVDLGFDGRDGFFGVTGFKVGMGEDVFGESGDFFVFFEGLFVVAFGGELMGFKLEDDFFERLGVAFAFVIFLEFGELGFELVEFGVGEVGLAGFVVGTSEQEVEFVLFVEVVGEFKVFGVVELDGVFPEFKFFEE